jgi:hypothetical protein
MSDDEGFLNEQINFFKKEDAESSQKSRLANSTTLDLQLINDADKVQTPLRDFKVKKHFLDSACELSKSTEDFTQKAKPQPKAVPARASKETCQGVSAPDDDVMEMNNLIKNLMESGDNNFGSMARNTAEKQISNNNSTKQNELKPRPAKAAMGNSETTKSQSDFEISESFFKVSDTEELDVDSNATSSREVGYIEA